MSWNAPAQVVVSNGFPFREGEDEYDLKMQFAAEVALNPSQASTAGYRLFKGPENYGRAMQAQMWLSDPDVQTEIARLAGTELANSLLPNDDQVKLEIWNTARGAHDIKLKIAALDLYTKVTGMQKADAGSGNNVLIQNVIQLPRRIEGADEEARFARDFEKQQLKLVKDAKSPVKD